MTDLHEKTENEKQDIKFLSAAESADYWRGMFLAAMKRIQRAKKIAEHPPVDKAILKALSSDIMERGHE